MTILVALLTIAAASDLQPVMPKLVASFERQTGQTVQVAYGSSGNFVAQIRNGAPFDVFLSADAGYPRQLEAAGLVEPGTVYVYATGALVVWTRRGSPVDLSRGLAALTDARVTRVAIANPDHAPYGRAAAAALRSAHLYEQVGGKLVRGENVAQAAQFVQSGNADAGILPLSLARSPALSSAGQYVLVPASLYPPIEQAAAVLRSSAHKDAARAFVEYLKAAGARAVLAADGFGPPPPAAR